MALLQLAGCASDDNDINTVYVNGSDAIQILSPAPNDTLRLIYHWQDATAMPYARCPWGWLVDTAFSVNVHATATGGVNSARVYMQESYLGSFYPTNNVIQPATGSFSLPFFTRQGPPNYSNEYPLNGAFCVGIITGDESFLLSRTIPYTIVFTYDSIAVTAPAPPLGEVKESSGSSDYLIVRWCQRLPGANLDTIFLRTANNTASFSPAMPGDGSEVQFMDYLPDADYQIWLVATNAQGTSPASDTLLLHTRTPALPTALHASLNSPSAVTLDWINHRWCDSLLVARRTTTGLWNTIDTIAGNHPYEIGSYDDATVTAQTSYYYRLGLAFPTGEWWCTDSLFIAVP